MPPELTHAVAAFAHDVTLSQVPEDALERARTAILDTLGVMLAARDEPVARIVIDYARSTGSTGPAGIVGHPLRTAPETAALVNGVLAHALDFDDRGHISTHTLPVCLAVGEAVGANGADVLLAYVIGREVRAHLTEPFDRGRFEAPGPGSRGWHSTGVVGSLGAAATAARLLRLDVETTASALGTAASLAGGLIANFGTMTKPLHAGNAARNGVLAATLAQAGFSGEPSVLTATQGFADAFFLPGELDAAAVAAGLGHRFLLAEKGIRIKPYPCCTGTHGYIEAVRGLRAETGLEASQVESVVCTTSGSLNRPYPKNALECKFSAAFAVAATLIDGEVNLVNCTETFLHRPDVQDLLSRTTYDLDATREYIRVTTRGGRVHEVAVQRPPRNLVTRTEVEAKFAACAAPALGEGRAAAVAEAAGRLQDLGSVRELTDLLR